MPLSSTSLFVRGVLPAEPAELLVLHPARLFLLVLRRRVVPVLALRAFQRDDVSHVDASPCYENLVVEPDSASLRPGFPPEADQPPAENR